MNGILVINKPKNITSRDVVNKASEILNVKKIGHTGTLDPLATGVLILTVNKATKIAELITNYDKEYVAEVVLGIKTDTLDATGKITEEINVKISKKDINRVLHEMVGFYEQEVPIYSAVKINGKKLYEYARENKEIELPKKNVVIKELELVSDVEYVDGKTIFKIKCLVSKGTYIRSLIRDIASNLNTIGIMKNLTRTKQGEFNLSDTISLDEISIDKIIPVKEVLKNYKQIDINEELYNDIKNGRIIENKYNCDVICFKYQSEVKAIYKKYEKDNRKMKPWKML